MAVFCKWRSFANGGPLQIAVFCKWRSFANGGLLQMAVFCKWRSFANGCPLAGRLVWTIHQRAHSIRLNSITCKVTVSREVTMINLVSRSANSFSKILCLLNLIFWKTEELEGQHYNGGFRHAAVWRCVSSGRRFERSVDFFFKVSRLIINAIAEIKKVEEVEEARYGELQINMIWPKDAIR